MLLKSGEVLEEALQAAGLTKTELAQAVGCHRSFVSNLVHGRERTCTPTLAARIAEELNKPLRELFDGRGANQVSVCAACGQRERRRRPA